MYHFLFVLSGKLFRNFNKYKNINLESEQIIDFCPKCNVKLANKKVITLLEHEKEFHPKTEKQTVSDFYRKGSVQMYMVLLCLLFLAIIVILLGSVTSFLWEAELTDAQRNAYEFCSLLMEEYPDLDLLGDTEQSRNDRTEYALDNIEDLKKCGYSITISSVGNKNDRIEHYLSSDD